jgi:pyroglutamyl-peptidase
MTAPRPILVTGFEPFGGDTMNPSEQVARALHGTQVGGVAVVGLTLPCTFAHAAPVLCRAIDDTRPRLVLAMGQAAGRTGLTVERVAINVADARMPDNAGAQPVDEPVVPGGHAAHFASLPIKAMVAAVQAAALPASVSQTAGTFVCNHVFYALMHHLLERPGTRGGFMHLPLLPSQVRAESPQPSLSLQDMVRGVRAALEAALAHAHDRPITGGAEH